MSGPKESSTIITVDCSHHKLSEISTIIPIIIIPIIIIIVIIGKGSGKLSNLASILQLVIGA